MEYTRKIIVNIDMLGPERQSILSLHIHILDVLWNGVQYGMGVAQSYFPL